MLKFEGIPVGKTILSYDFKPYGDENDSFVVGIIKGISDNEFKHYVIEVLADTINERVGLRVNVPMELAFSEYDGRITVIGG